MSIDTRPQYLEVPLPDLSAVDPELQPLAPPYGDEERPGIQVPEYYDVRATLRLDRPIPVTGVDEQADFANEVAQVRAVLIRRYLAARRAGASALTDTTGL